MSEGVGTVQFAKPKPGTYTHSAMQRVTGRTRLSDLHKVAKESRPSNHLEEVLRLVRSVQQSLEVEGYPASEASVREAADRVFGTLR